LVVEGLRQNRMYEGVRTWNPFVGCKHGCVYCVPSFQRQAKRRRKWCELCYRFEPHFHPERLDRIPKAKTIFACAYGDVAFANVEWLVHIVGVIKEHGDRTFYLQSKDPECFEGLVEGVDNLVVGTTIETNRLFFETPSEFTAYSEISQAPHPFWRYSVLTRLDARKYVTIEPILDFDLPKLVSGLRAIQPEYVYIGYDNHNCRLPEPPLEKTLKLIEELERFTEVRLKTIRKAWYEEG